LASADDRFGLVLNLYFASESGSAADLGNCLMIEKVTPGAAPNPPFASSSVTVQTTPYPCSAGNWTDEHDYPISAVDWTWGTDGSYATAQTYVWWDTVLGSPSNANSILSDTITRTVTDCINPLVPLAQGYSFTTAVSGGFSFSSFELGP
jgi:hypothetical protein